MFYTIYKITNKIDKKIYIGKHQTKDLNDVYMGSGKRLKRAQEKYGIENFEKEILFQFDSESDMNAKEAELVTEEFCLREDTYNLCPGGNGGFGYINSNNLAVNLREQWKNNRETMIKNSIRSGKIGGTKVVKDRLSKGLNPWGINPGDAFKGKKHSEEWKQRQSLIMKEKSLGTNNSQYGSMWITDGIQNKKIKKEDFIPEGWYRGRKIKS